MKEIPLNHNKVALVDDEDFQFLLGFKWHAQKDRRIWYASCVVEGQIVKMHFLILPTNKPLVVDHIDSNGLNNQRLNLRRVTQQQNSQNRRKALNCCSEYKGVFLQKKTGKWGAQIQINSDRTKRKFLGYFYNEMDAALAYDIAAKSHFGEYAKLNLEGA